MTRLCVLHLSLVALFLVSRIFSADAQLDPDNFKFIDDARRAILAVDPQEPLRSIRNFETQNSTLPSLDSDNIKFIDEARRAFPTVDLSNVLQLLVPNFDDENSTFPIATECVNQLQLVGNLAQNGTMWAMKMIDASSKIPSGILMGNQVDLGMFDECMDVREIVEDKEFRGRHCMYTLVSPMKDFSLTETLSICVPSSCEPNDVIILVRQALNRLEDLVGIPIHIDVTAATCTSVEPMRWTTGGIITLCGFAILLLFLAVSTIADFFLRTSKNVDSPNKRLVFLSQFSLYTNAVRVLSTKATPQTLPALQGIRFFSMCWVIFGHSYFMGVFSATLNMGAFLGWVRSWTAIHVLIGTFSVDSFFTLSGFLMSYLFLKEMSKGRSFNIFAYYIHRYLRLTPALGALLLMTLFILPRVGSGATWERNMNTMSDNCRYNWWPMLLYVHNYVDREHLFCLAHTWYLAVEMHYFWLSPFVLYPLAKKPKLGLLFLFLCFVASIVTPAVIAYQNHYSGSVFTGNDMENVMTATTKFYMASHIRATPWLIGICAGFLVFHRKSSPDVITQAIGWIASIIGFAFCYFSMRVFQAEDYVWSATWEIFFIVVSKPFWAGSLCWIIYISVCGLGGPISKILSFGIYTPFARISYCVYLVHFIVQIMRSSASRTSRYFDEFNCLSQFIIDFVFSVVVGFFFTLIFESPILILEKMLRNSSRKNMSESRQELRHERPGNGIVNPALEKD